MINFNGIGPVNPGTLYDVQKRALDVQRQAGAPQQNMTDQQRSDQYRDSYQQEKQKQMMTQVLMNLAHGSVGRGTPQYNMHEQQGRDGLVDPSLTGQQTRLPLPFDQQYASTANLMGIIQALPPALGQANNQILAQADSIVPQMQRALKQPSTIYEQVPGSFVVNRFNIAMQRKREDSLYGYA